MADTFFYGVGDEVVITLLIGIIVVFAAAYFAYRFHIYQQENIRNVIAGDNQSRPARIFNTEQCPICLGPHRLPLETNCGHKFCGVCLKNYLENRVTEASNFSPFGGRVTCPMCRQYVNLLLVCFTQHELNHSEMFSERTAIETMAYEFNVRYGSGPRTLMSYIRDFPVLFRHMVSEFFSFGNILWMFKLRVLLCLLVSILYLFLPSDIIPETIFGFVGLLDDIIIFFLCAVYVSNIYRQFLVNQAALGAGETNS